MKSSERLLSASKLVIVLSKKFRKRVMIHYDDLMAAIADAPTVDAVEVVHGRWEYWAGGLETCSVCGYEYTDYLECHNYCGNCGAKMERGEENGKKHTG